MKTKTKGIVSLKIKSKVLKRLDKGKLLLLQYTKVRDI